MRLEAIGKSRLTWADSPPAAGIDSKAEAWNLQRTGSGLPYGRCERLNRREAHLPTKHPETGSHPWVPQAHVHAGGAGNFEVAAAQGAPPSHRLKALVPPRTVGRITRRAAFAELQRSRARGASGPVRVTFLPAPRGEHGVFPQVAYAIGRSCGNAVVRNSLRRRAREVVRAEAPTLARGTYLVRLEPDAAALAHSAYRTDVATALLKAGKGRAAA
jgi:ribonuclease P protein component